MYLPTIMIRTHKNFFFFKCGSITCKLSSQIHDQLFVILFCCLNVDWEWWSFNSGIPKSSTIPAEIDKLSMIHKYNFVVKCLMFIPRKLRSHPIGPIPHWRTVRSSSVHWQTLLYFGENNLILNLWIAFSYRSSVHGNISVSVICKLLLYINEWTSHHP